MAEITAQLVKELAEQAKQRQNGGKMDSGAI